MSGWPRRPGLCAVVLVAAAILSVSCGKKGPPLPPLRLVPAPVADVAGRRAAEQIQLRFTLPSRNQNGPGPVQLDRVEIYAVTVAPGAPAPPNRELLTRARLVGTVEVKPEPEEGAEPDPADTRPSPGDRVTFTEAIGPEQLRPVVLQASAPSPTAAPSAAAARVSRAGVCRARHHPRWTTRAAGGAHQHSTRRSAATAGDHRLALHRDRLSTDVDSAG